MTGNIGDIVLGGGAGRRDEVKRARALTVQTEVLREGLRDTQLEALLDEVSHRPGVAVQVARGETLVCGIKEGEVPALAHDDGELLPLVLGEVDTGRVVGAGVEEDDGTSRGLADAVQHAIEVEAFRLRIEVGVGGEGETDIGEDLVVVGPGWVGEVDGGLGVRGVEFGEEEGTEMDGSCAGDGLESGHLIDLLESGGTKAGLRAAYSLFADRRAVGTQDHLLGGRGEFRETLDGEVFIVDGGIVANQITGLTSLVQLVVRHLPARFHHIPFSRRGGSKALHCHHDRHR